MRGKARPLEIRRYLVSVYVTQGYAAAKPLAIKYGYHPRYLNHLARDVLGHRRTIFYSRDQLITFQSYRFDPRFASAVSVESNIGVAA